MRLLTLILVCCLARPIAASAQQDHGRFFVFAAPAEARSDAGPHPSIVHVGGGGEAALAKGGGVGVEIGGLVAGPKAALLSANGFGHVLGQHHFHLDPYLAAGVTLFAHDTHQKSGLANVGGGVNYWLTARRGYNFGLEFGYRRFLLGGAGRPPSWEARVGLTLWQ